jgi:hypothetical protein
METKPASLSTPPPTCKRCGKAMTPLYNVLDPNTGKHAHVFKCECGNRAVG